MEHGLLTNPVYLGRENLIETYLGLARAVPEATTQLRDGFIYAEGPRDLSFCNFAAGFGPTENYSQRLDWLTQVGKARSGFWVFCIDGDEPVRMNDALRHRGFVMRQSLRQMVADPVRSDEPEVFIDRAVQEVKGLGERLEVCRFAARTFFKRTSPESQERIAEATARSGHRLLAQFDDQGSTAAMMLCESPGAVGLYNLCIRPEMRRQGLGAGMVWYALRWAEHQRKPLILQCDPELEEWYVRLGFHQFGTVYAYTFGSTKLRDII